MSAQEASGTTPIRPHKRPASLACYQCRRKHLRCDGAVPICARCASAATTCTYLPSRRGLSGRQNPQQHYHDCQDSAGRYKDAWTGTHDAAAAAAAAPQPPALSDAASVAGAANTDILSNPAGTNPDTFPLPAAERNNLIGLYYSHFHRSHPMLVPRAYFAAQQYPDFLVFAACLAGRHFASDQPPERSPSVAFTMVVSAVEADSSHRIQAFILLALISLGSHDMSRANECLGIAVPLAMEAKLDRLDSFVQATPSIERESLRRTWWELFAVDALLALLQGRPPKITASNPNALPCAPCEDALYEAGHLRGRQPNYAEFERRFFLQRHDEFSSHFYRIEAVLIVRQVQPFFTGDNVDPQELEAVCNAIASWPYHLPDSSFDLSASTGDPDSVLIQAHLLVQIASIFLHFPRSHLTSSGPSAIDLTCLSKGPLRLGKSRQHGIQAIVASRELCHIASIPFLRDGHSPVAIPGFLLGSAIQLSTTAASHQTQDPRQSQQCRHRVVLMLGALKYIGKTWPSGRMALHRVQPFADLAFTASHNRGLRDVDAPSGIGVNATSEPSRNIALETVAGEQDLEPNIGLMSQDSLLDIDWFDFFQHVDPPPY